MSAYNRQAIAPMWEVKTAKLQGDAGAVNAGLSEEERAAKAGLSAALDAAYAASHTQDATVKNKRIGSFMAVALDMNNSGTITTTTIAQDAALNDGNGISFNWDDQSYQKRVGWVGDGSATTDGFLVLDRDFNQSVDNGTELLSNPLVADPAKGLRSLATWDADGDGRITAADPVYYQLKVWQDFNQDGNNTHGLTIADATGGNTVIVQDETSFSGSSVKELRTLAELGITAIDYANNRYEFADATQPNGVGYRQIATVTLQAEQEGVRYTPVGAGIKIDTTDGSPQIIITQIASEAAVYSALSVVAKGEHIGVDNNPLTVDTAPLYEDGQPTPYNPLVVGPIRLKLTQAQLLANDTWHNQAGIAAGLQVVSISNASHLSDFEFLANGEINYRLEANFSGEAGFDYTVLAPDGSTSTAHLAMSVTAVADTPVVTVATDAQRLIYGYRPQAWTYNTGEVYGEFGFPVTASGVSNTDPFYAPYVEFIPGVPILTPVYGGGEDGFTVTYVQTGTTPDQNVPHYTPIASELAVSGQIAASNPDGGVFTYTVLQQGTYGHGSVDTDGRWSYTATRPNFYSIGDVDANGAQDYLNPDNGIVMGAGTYPISSNGVTNVNANNRHFANDPGFWDTFTVRVTSSFGATVDKDVQAWHYGPPPKEHIAPSGGKKPIAVDLNGDGFHFTDVDDSNVFFDVNGDG